MKKYLEYKDGKSQKFWEIALNGNQFTTRYGKIGADGTSKTKEFESEEKAQKEFDKLLKQKEKKGYAELVSYGKEITNEPFLRVRPDEFKEKYPSIQLSEVFFIEFYGEYIKVFEEDAYFDNLIVAPKSEPFLSDHGNSAMVFLKNLTVKGSIYGEFDMCSYLHVCGDLEAGTLGYDLEVKVDSNLLVKNFLITSDRKVFKVEGESDISMQIHHDGYLRNDKMFKDIIYLVGNDWWEENLGEELDTLLENVIDDEHPFRYREVSIFDVIDEYWDQCKELVNNCNIFPEKILEYVLRKETKGLANKYTGGSELVYLVKNDSAFIYQKVMEEIEKIRNNQSDFRIS